MWKMAIYGALGFVILLGVMLFFVSVGAWLGRCLISIVARIKCVRWS